MLCSSCKRVIALQAQKQKQKSGSISKVTQRQVTLKDRLCFERNARGKRNATKTNGSRIQIDGEKGEGLHCVLSSDDEVCIRYPSNTSKLWSFTVDKCKKRVSISVDKESLLIYNRQAMLLHQTKAPLSQTC